ncbi:PREDICTED: early nodulin-93-like isoform X2 [Nelumbo nucifera]|uniref:Early nodulin-93-like isoform X2 n=1 Tax=Nelumbo nucifera TaxID=4432 RepID=A0A1U7Z998_NELNU|nr:PREDICTED: early nodulin-93-like isoform X2 [Nelumbo nucifera]
MAKKVAQYPLEKNGLASLDQKLSLAKRCGHEGVVAGAKAAVLATIASAIPTPVLECFPGLELTSIQLLRLSSSLQWLVPHTS